MALYKEYPDGKAYKSYGKYYRNHPFYPHRGEWFNDDTAEELPEVEVSANASNVNNENETPEEGNNTNTKGNEQQTQPPVKTENKNKGDGGLTTAELYQRVTGRSWKNVKNDARYGDMYDGSFEKNMAIRKDLMRRYKEGERDNTESYSQNEARTQNNNYQLQEIGKQARNSLKNTPSEKPGENLPPVPKRSQQTPQEEKKRKGLRGFFRG